MGGKTDEAKGQIKEAAGILTDNEKVRAEGQVAQAVAKVKQIAEGLLRRSTKLSKN